MKARQKCDVCKYPWPMHKPLCESNEQRALGLREALLKMLSATQGLPLELTQRLSLQPDFLNAFRAGKEALR